MAREIVLRCDVCRKPTKRIVAKMNYIPSTSRRAHSNYTHHLDVGECCGERVLKLFNWKQRMSKKEYADSRRNGG